MRPQALYYYTGSCDIRQYHSVSNQRNLWIVLNINQKNFDNMLRKNDKIVILQRSKNSYFPLVDTFLNREKSIYFKMTLVWPPRVKTVPSSFALPTPI